MPTDPTPILAPPAQPPRYSLVSVAADAALAGEALLHGWVFDPELCAGARGGIIDVDCIGTTPDPPTGMGDAGTGMQVSSNPAQVSGDGFAIYATDRCSAFDINRRDWQGRADRAINAVESYWLARQFSTGAPGTTTQMSLNDVSADDVTGGPLNAVHALAALEGAMAESLRGQRGHVHVSPAVATLLLAANAIRRDGNLWVTATENVVIIDAGYNGAGPGDLTPDAGTAWIYGTSMVRVALGERQIIPGSLDEAVARQSAVDKALNTVTLYVAKLATWVWDECALIAAEVDTSSLPGS